MSWRDELPWAVLFLFAGHLALMQRLGGGWFDLLLLDLWLLPLWFAARNLADKEAA